MENMDNENEIEGEAFSYTYSAVQQEEIKNIRKRYLPPEEDKMERLRKLDRKVTQKGASLSLAIGIIGSLIMGTGMSMCMVMGGNLFIPGILIGLIGMIPVALAYPIYVRVTKKERAKIADEVIRLTDELLK